jgi:hypothetical protein
MKALIVLAVLALAACTFVYISGNENDIEDTGGHGGGLEIAPHAASQPTLIERLQHQH